MKTFPDLGKILKCRYYPEEGLLILLSHSEKEPNKHKIFFSNLVEGGGEGWLENWKHFDIETEVIDFCFGSTSKFLFVARKGQHIEKF
jgi:hypothetical protein